MANLSLTDTGMWKSTSHSHRRARGLSRSIWRGVTACNQGMYICISCEKRPTEDGTKESYIAAQGRHRAIVHGRWKKQVLQCR